MDIPTEKFLLPLDELDWNLAPLSSLLKNKYMDDRIMPIWAKTGLDTKYENQYYEFEVILGNEDLKNHKKNLLNEEKDFKHYDNPEEYTCFICNIDVPKAYNKEHEKSAKHKTYLAITDNALDRIKKHLAQDIDMQNINTNNRTYFCNSCTVAVKIDEKAKHAASKEHANAVIHDKILNDLLFVYIENDKLKKCIETSVKKQDLDEAKNKVEDKNANNKIKNSHDEKVSDETKIVEKLVDFITERDPKNLTIEDLIDLTSEAKKLKDLIEYVKALNTQDIPGKPELTVINGDTIEIKTTTGVKLNVSVGNFHGFSSVRDRLQCKVCRILVQDIETHIFKPDHMRKIMQPIQDKHCVRQLDAIWSHCILCNDIIENLEVHISRSEIHETLVNKALLPITIEDLSSETQDICDLTLPVSESNRHLGSMKHWRALKKQQLSINEQIKSGLHYHMERVKNTNEIICRICKVFVSDSIEDDSVLKHISSDVHFEKFKLILASNKLKVLNGRCQCEVCDVYMSESYLLLHIESTKHKKRMVVSDDGKSIPDTIVESATKFEENARSVPIHLNIDDNKVISKEKSVKTPTTFESDQFPVVKRRFTHKYRQLVVANKLIKLENGMHLCGFCDVTVPAFSEIEHCDTDEHKKKAEGKKFVEQSTTIPDQEIPEAWVLHPLMIPTNSPCTLECILCKIRVRNKMESVDSHIRSVGHNIKLKEELEMHRIRGDEDRYFCEICLDYVAHCSEIDHINSAEHKRHIIDEENTASRTVSMETNIVVEKVAGSRHNTKLNKNAKRIKTQQPHHLMEFTDDHNAVRCKICKTTLPKNNIALKNHRKGATHKANYESVLAENSLNKCKNKLYCKVCDVLLAKRHICDHIKTLSHLNKLKCSYYRLSNKSYVANEVIDAPDVTNPNFNTNRITDQQGSLENLDYEASKPAVEGNAAGLKINTEEIKDENLKPPNAYHNVSKKTKVKALKEQIREKYQFSNFDHLIAARRLQEVACNVCKVTIPNTKENIREHFSGSKHIRKYIAILSLNELHEMLDDFYCKYCNEHVAGMKEILHINSTTHSTNVEKVQKLISSAQC